MKHLIENNLILFKFYFKNGFQALNKKEHKGSSNGCDSPEPDDSQYTLTPRNENKYKLNDDFELMMQRNSHINGNRVSNKIICNNNFIFFLI